MTLRLTASAAALWPSFDGWLASRSIDPFDLDIDRFLNLIYHWLVKDAQEQSEIDRFNIRLWVPPKGEVPTSGPWSPENETKAFAAFSAQVNGGPAPRDRSS